MNEFLIANMAPIMFASLIVFLMFGYAVTFSLAACGLFFGFVAVELGVIQPAFLQGLVPDPTKKQGSKTAEEELAEFLLQKEVAAREATQMGAAK